MTENEFWKLMDHVDTEALQEGDEGTAAEPLIDALSAYEPQEIEQFEEHLAQALYRLDGRRYADNAGDSGQSDDGFLYARCYVVGCGRARYESTLNDPTQMPGSIDHWFEGLLFVPAEAWARATGNEPEDWEFDVSVSYETGSNTSQW